MRRIWTGVTKAVSCKRVCNINIRITMETMESQAKERTVHWPSPFADSFQAKGFILFEIVQCGFFLISRKFQFTFVINFNAYHLLPNLSTCIVVCRTARILSNNYDMFIYVSMSQRKWGSPQCTGALR